MKMVSKFMSKLNNQLIVTLLVIIIGIIISFGMILPVSIRYLFDHKIYELILSEQASLIQQAGAYDKTMSEENGVYHLLCGEDGYNNNITNEIDSEILHQLLMYEDFFKQINRQIIKEDKGISTHKYNTNQDTIYYVINKNMPNQVVISYKIDNTSSGLSHQLFMNILMIMVVTVILILLIFLKWNMRLINNLKAIQHSLDNIEGYNLKQPILTDSYTEEFQDVMLSLERMRQRLYEDEKVKQGMIHNISHDLKTPLAVIKNYAEGIIDSVYPYGTLEETAHVIYNQADRLQKKVQGLLYLNKLDYIRSQKETYDTFKIKGLVFEVVGYMQDLEDTVKIRAKADDSRFIGDIEKWRIVIENLLDNAKRYAIHEIIITVEEGVLTVYNDGPHIDLNISGSLFKPFESGKGGVTGLGLAIVKKTVALYNYKISFQNISQGGVMFTVQ